MKQNKSAPKVSVLVPIYNVEQYLRQCLDSVVGQTLKSIEIICINDGSTDNSLEIVKEYAKKDKRIIIIDKKNSGYGDSMNKGLNKAKGKYIGIVESDDWAEPDMFESLYELAEKHKVDIVKSNFYCYKSSDHSSTLLPLIKDSEVGRLIDPKKNTHILFQAPSIWAAIYRRDFLTKNAINFLPTPGASYQDTGFNWKAWASTDKVAYTNRAYLHYRIDNESSSVHNLEKVFCIQKEWVEIEKFLRDKNIYDELSSYMIYAKFGAYYWNLNRLDRKSAKKFLPFFRKEFKQSAKNGSIDYSVFAKEHAYALKAILRYPQAFFYIKPIHKLYRRGRSVLGRIKRKIHG